jgi:hypothetical protein
LNIFLVIRATQTDLLRQKVLPRVAPTRGNTMARRVKGAGDGALQYFVGIARGLTQRIGDAQHAASVVGEWNDPRNAFDE